MDPNLGGGSLYDIGIYALQLATLCLDDEYREMKPIVLHKDKEINRENVDMTFRAVLLYKNKVYQNLNKKKISMIGKRCFDDI